MKFNTRIKCTKCGELFDAEFGFTVGGSKYFWHDVKKGLPELNKHGESERVLINIHDPDKPDDDATQWEIDFYEPHYVVLGYIKKTTTGQLVWLDYGDHIVEDFDCVVTHWMPKPDPAGA